MAFANTYLPMGFKKTKKSKVTPRARFEALAVGVALALAARPALARTGPQTDVTAWLASDDFKDKTTSDGANVISKLRARIDYVRDKLLAV